jgi:hypothetical protein
MKTLMHKTVYAALLGVALAGAPLAAFAQEGPRPSSMNNWPGMVQAAPAPAANATNGGYGSPDVNPAASVFQAPVTNADPVFAGPRPSQNH